MPQITQTNIIDITPQRFVEKCSDVELQELALELDRELSRRNIGQEVRELDLNADF